MWARFTLSTSREDPWSGGGKGDYTMSERQAELIEISSAATGRHGRHGRSSKKGKEGIRASGEEEESINATGIPGLDTLNKTFE